VRSILRPGQAFLLKQAAEKFRNPSLFSFPVAMLRFSAGSNAMEELVLQEIEGYYGPHNSFLYTVNCIPVSLDAELPFQLREAR
jgi:hypothetical protein